MEYRKLGRAGVRVSAIGLGGNTFGRMYGHFNDEAATADIISAALELGVNFIDTAESYAGGVSEEYVGRAIRGRRDQFVIATKTGAMSRPEPRLTRGQILTRLDASLCRLRTDYVDLYYLHFPDPSTDLEETLRALDDMVRAGKVLYPAVSNYPAWEVSEIQALCDRRGFAPPVVSQNAYNLVVRDVERELVPALDRHGMSIVAYEPLGSGFLTGKYRRGSMPEAETRAHGNERWQAKWLTDRNFGLLERWSAFAAERGRNVGELALAWLLARPRVCSAIVGVTSVEQLRSNVAALDWRLSEADLAEVG